MQIIGYIIQTCRVYLFFAYLSMSILFNWQKYELTIIRMEVHANLRDVTDSTMVTHIVCH